MNCDAKKCWVSNFQNKTENGSIIILGHRSAYSIWIFHAVSLTKQIIAARFCSKCSESFFQFHTDALIISPDNTVWQELQSRLFQRLRLFLIFSKLIFHNFFRFSQRFKNASPQCKSSKMHPPMQKLKKHRWEISPMQSCAEVQSLKPHLSSC